MSGTQSEFVSGLCSTTQNASLAKGFFAIRWTQRPHTGDLLLPGLVYGHMHLDKTLFGLPWTHHAALDAAAPRGCAGVLRQ